MIISRIDEGVPHRDAGDVFELRYFNPPDRFDMIGRDGETIKGRGLPERGRNLLAVREDVFDRTPHRAGILSFYV